VKLQKVPRGLLELFKLRQTGEYPDDMSKMLMPIVDVSAFYGSDTLIPASSAPTVGAIGGELLETLITTGTIGILALGGVLTIGAAAATNMTLSWGIVLPGPFPRSVFGSQFVAQAAAANQVSVGSAFPRVVVPAGTTLYVGVSGTAAGADHSLAIAGLLENLTGTAG